MMPSLAPKWALSAQAIDSAGNPYLARGVHLRIVPSQEFGLPLAPFMIYREDITQVAERFMRTDIIWTDARGRVLTPPFNIPSGQRVTGWLPPLDTGVCCWIQAQLEKTGPGGVRMDALVHNARLPLKPAVIASTTRVPPTLSASRIDRIVLSGDAQVFGARWIDARTLAGRLKPKFWKLLPMPVASGARYISVPGAQAEAKDRVTRGAPPHMGRHEERTPFFASTGGAVTPADEIDRVGLFTPDLDQWLEQLINDLSRPADELETPYTVEAQGAKPMARERLLINTLGLLMQSAMDPGAARYLGFMEVDPESSDHPPGTLIAYFVRGLFRFDKERQSRLLRALSGEQVISPEEGRAILEEFELHLPALDLDAVVDLSLVAVTTIANPPDVPGSPHMLPADISGPFLPAVPPHARREVILNGNDLTPLAALERIDSDGAHSLNALTRDHKRALPLIPGIPDPSVTDVDATFADRNAPPEALLYRIAMADWFGRWGDWSQLVAGSKPRPQPPAPAPNVHYTPPVVTDATLLDPPLGGLLRVEIPVPPLENLPAGGFPLDKAQLTFKEGTTVLFTQTEDPADPHTLPGRKLIVTFDNHASLRVNRAATRTVSLSARWQDTGGNTSHASPPIAVEMTDPRPPIAVSIPGMLKYSARPDVTGLARVDLRWPIDATQRRFRVYYADEIAARAYLERKAPSDPASSVALAALDAADSPVDRATVFKTHASALGPAAFDQLTRSPLEFSSGEGRFIHQLSGSLQVLSLYRIVSVSASNVEAPFGSSALVPVGVPNTAPPAQPFLTIRSIPNGSQPRSDRLALVVEAARRPTRPVEYRLRRSTVDATNALAMPIQASGALPAPDGEQVRIEIEQGLDTADPLRPWIKYFWRVEVRGEPEPGSTGGAAGQWSTSSAPASATLIPPGPPASIEELAIEATETSHTLTWTHPNPRLDGGTAGVYKFEIFQQKPNDRIRSIGSLLALAPASAGGRPTPTDSFTFVTAVDESAGIGTAYRVVLTDPLHRASPPCTATVTSIAEPPPAPPDDLPDPPTPPPPAASPSPAAVVLGILIMIARAGIDLIRRLLGGRR